MNEKIHIPIPPESEDDDAVCLLGYLEDFKEQLSGAFDLKVDDGDCRTTYVDHRITDAVPTGDGIAIHYEIDTHTYHGCKDMDFEDTIWRSVTGVSNGIHWVFSPSMSPDPRSTLEEF